MAIKMRNSRTDGRYRFSSTVDCGGNKILEDRGVIFIPGRIECRVEMRVDWRGSGLEENKVSSHFLGLMLRPMVMSLVAT